MDIGTPMKKPSDELILKAHWKTFVKKRKTYRIYFQLVQICYMVGYILYMYDISILSDEFNEICAPDK